MTMPRYGVPGGVLPPGTFYFYRMTHYFLSQSSPLCGMQSSGLDRCMVIGNSKQSSRVSLLAIAYYTSAEAIKK